MITSISCVYIYICVFPQISLKVGGSIEKKHEGKNENYERTKPSQVS